MPLKSTVKKTIAVIIPYYNGSKTIERAARSVLDQTHLPDEFIVVNDGSNDVEAAFLYEASRRNGFQIIDKENGGQGSARNAGVAASSADYICFLDQDDCYLKNHNELLLAAIPEDDPQFGWAYADLFEADGEGAIIRHSIVSDFENPKSDIYRMLKSDLFILPSASIIKREAFEAVGGFDPQFTGYEDDDLFLRMFRKGFTNCYLDKAVTVWCIHGESTSYSVRMTRSRVRYFDKLLAEFPDEPAMGRLYYSKGIYPRFRGLFLTDAHNTLMRNTLSEHTDEIMGNLKRFIAVSKENGHVSKLGLFLLQLRYLVFVTKSKRFISLAERSYRLLSSLSRRNRR